MARSNTDARSSRHSAHRVRERLCEIEMQAGTKLLTIQKFNDPEGVLDFEEFKSLLQTSNSLRVTNAEARELMKKYDEDGSGTINLDEFCFNLTVPKQRFQEFVQEKGRKRQACRSLPFIFMTFAAFLAAVFFQAQTKYSFEMHEVIHEALVRNAPLHPETVTTVPGMWQWVKQTLVPAVNFQSLACGPATGKACIGPSNFVLSNRIILLQKRAQNSGILACDSTPNTARKRLRAVYAPDGCPDQDEDLKIGLPICSDEANATCVPKPEWNVSQRWPKDVLNSSSTGFELKSIPDYDCAAGFLCSSSDVGYSFNLDAGSPKKLLKQLTYLEDRRWIGTRTASVEILFVVYNPQVGLLGKVRMTFHLHPGGDIVYHLLVDSILEPVQWETWDMFFSVVWWLIIISLPLQDLIITARLGQGNEGMKKLISKKFWCSPWRFLTIAHILVMIVMFILWHVIIIMTLQFADVSVDGFGEMSKLHQAVDYFFFYRGLAITVDLMFLLRFFHSFVAVDQFSIIYVTVITVGVELFNFAAVLAIILSVFISSSMLIFGNQLKNFATVLEALATNYHGIVGELDFESLLSVEHIKYLAFAWWAMYVFFVVIVVFNMMLAIVLRSYKDSYNEHANARSFYDQLIDEITIVRAKVHGWITLGAVVNAIKCVDNEEVNFVSAKYIYHWLEKHHTTRLRRNPQYARQYLLSLFQEYVIGQDVKSKGHAMKSYKRIAELDGDFEHLHTRIDDITLGIKTIVRHVDLAAKLGGGGAARVTSHLGSLRGGVTRVTVGPLHKDKAVE